MEESNKNESRVNEIQFSSNYESLADLVESKEEAAVLLDVLKGGQS